MVVVSTSRYEPKRLVRWLEANHLCAGLDHFIIFIDGAGDLASLHAQLQHVAPACQISIHQSAETDALANPKRQQMNLAAAREKLPHDAWIIALDSDEVIWVPPRIRRAHAKPLERIIAAHLKAEDIRFMPVEAILGEGEQHKEIPAKAWIKWGMPTGTKPPWPLRIARLLTWRSGPWIDGNLFLANSFSKSMAKGTVPRLLHHHGFVNWAADADAFPLESVWTTDALLVHFDFLNSDDLLTKSLHIERQLAAGHSRSSNRTKFVKGYLAAQRRGKTSEQIYKIQFIHIKKWVQSVLKALHLIDVITIPGRHAPPAGQLIFFDLNHHPSARLANAMSAGLRPTSEWCFFPDSGELDPNQTCRRADRKSARRMRRALAHEMRLKPFMRLLISRELRLSSLCRFSFNPSNK